MKIRDLFLIALKVCTSVMLRLCGFLPSLKLHWGFFFFEDKRWDSHPAVWFPRTRMWGEAAQIWLTLNFAEFGCTCRVLPPTFCVQSGSVVALCCLSLVSHLCNPGVYREGTILEKMFDEAKDIFSCVCVALTNSVHPWRRKQSLQRGCGMRRGGKEEASLSAKRRQTQLYRQNL